METHDHDCNDNYHLADIYYNHYVRRDCCSDASRATGQTPRCERRPRRPTVAPYAGGSSRQNVPTTTTAEVGARHRDALNTRMFRSLWHCTLMCLSIFIAFSDWNGNAQPPVFATAAPLSSFVTNNPSKATSISFVSSLQTRTRQFPNDPNPPNCHNCQQTRPTTTNIHEYYHRYFTCHRWRRKCITVLQMGKGDGKKKRKKKSATSASTPQPPSPSPTPPPPPRVTTSINIPIRRQIRFANLKKEYLKSASTSFRASNVKKRTAYRKTLDEEEVEAAKLERQKRGREPDWDVILNATAATPLVLVDGYNVIHQWSRLKKWMVKAGQTSESGIGTGIGTANLQRARDLLVRDLEELHNIKGWRIECVFDGFGRSVVGPLGSGPGDKISSSDRVATATDTGRGVRIVYSGVGASADSYIESRCLDAKAITEGKTTGQLIVVSNDSMIRMVGTGAGALCMSSDRLVDELKAVKKASAYRVEAALAIANGVGYVRPEGLRNGMSEGARKMQSIHAFKAGGQFVIEDKRNKRKKKRNEKPSDGNGDDDDGDDDRTVDDGCRNGDEENKPKRKAVFEDLVEGTQTLPSWAIVPKNATDFRHRLR